VNATIGIVLGVWMGIGLAVALDSIGTALGCPILVNWDKMGRRGLVVAGILLLPWIVFVIGIGGPIALFAHFLKEIRDVIFYPKEKRTTPIFKALKFPFIWLYRRHAVSEHTSIEEGDA